MDNEEKILQILTEMQSGMKDMQSEQKQTNQRLDKLEQDMKRDLNDTSTEILSAVGDVIRNEMKEVKDRLTNVENDITNIRHSIAVIEIEHGEKLDALYDGWLANTEKLERQSELEARVEKLEIDMAAVHMTLKKKRKKKAE